MKQPEEMTVELPVIDGNALCKYVSQKFGMYDYEVYEIIMEHAFGTKDVNEGVLFELIIEDEAYCNDEGQYYRVLEFIAEEFGEHFNINFLSSCAYI